MVNEDFPDICILPVQLPQNNSSIIIEYNNKYGLIMNKNGVSASGIHLFSLFGFEVRLDWTWIFLAILITWTLATGYYPANFPDLSHNTYWIMGVIGTFGLFLSIIFHELCHSLVGRHYGISFLGITLFIFGGIAQMRDSPANPKTEFLMSIAGPLFSLIFGLALYLLFLLGVNNQWPVPINGVINYLSMINIAVGIFNLITGFPLDGGRIFRSILWWWTGDLKWATQVASQGGVILGMTMIFFGIFLFIQDAFIAGLWMFLLGFFLQHLSKTSYQDMMIREAFHGEQIRNYVKTNPITVNSNITIQELVDNYFYKYYYKLYPVLENGHLVACISLNEISQIPKEKWPLLHVKDVMLNNYLDLTVDADTEIMQLIQLMHSQRLSRMIVTDNGELYGVISLKDIMDIVLMKLRLKR